MWLSSVLVLNSSRANAVTGKTALRNAQDVCLRFIGLAVGGYVMTSAALAQQLPQPQQPLPPTSQQQPTPVQPSQQWQQLPHMQLERQFAGPLRDTVIQRWRDPADGTVCYIYLPITVQHSAVTPEGFVQYGANPIGSISCAPGDSPTFGCTERRPLNPGTRRATSSVRTSTPAAGAIAPGADLSCVSARRCVTRFWRGYLRMTDWGSRTSQIP